MFEKGLIKPSNALKPEKAILLGILRQETDGGIRGIMPKEPKDYTFSPESIERIKSWIRGDVDADGGDAGEVKDGGTDAPTDARDE
jgi:hypothetical protein